MIGYIPFPISPESTCGCYPVPLLNPEAGFVLHKHVPTDAADNCYPSLILTNTEQVLGVRTRKRFVLTHAPCKASRHLYTTYTYHFCDQLSA